MFKKKYLSPEGSSSPNAKPKPRSHALTTTVLGAGATGEKALHSTRPRRTSIHLAQSDSFMGPANS